MPINEVLARDHPEIFVLIEPAVWQKPWVAYAQAAGCGRTALRYLAAQVKKSTFSEGRLLCYDQIGCIVLSYLDSADGKLKSEALIRSSLSGAGYFTFLPKGRWLTPAAQGILKSSLPPRSGTLSHPACPEERTAALSVLQRPARPHRKDRASTRPPLCQAILKAAA